MINQYAVTFGPPDFDAPDPVSDGYIKPYDSSIPQQAYANNLSDDFITYIETNLNPRDYTSIEYEYGVQTLLLQTTEGLYRTVDKKWDYIWSNQ